MAQNCYHAEQLGSFHLLWVQVVCLCNVQVAHKVLAGSAKQLGSVDGDVMKVHLFGLVFEVVSYRELGRLVAQQ